MVSIARLRLLNRTNPNTTSKAINPPIMETIGSVKLPSQQSIIEKTRQELHLMRHLMKPQSYKDLRKDYAKALETRHQLMQADAPTQKASKTLGRRIFQMIISSFLGTSSSQPISNDLSNTICKIVGTGKLHTTIRINQEGLYQVKPSTQNI